MAQNSCYDNDIKHVLMTFGASLGKQSERGANVGLVRHCPEIMHSVIGVLAGQETQVKALWNDGGY